MDAANPTPGAGAIPVNPTLLVTHPNATSLPGSIAFAANAATSEKENFPNLIQISGSSQGVISAQPNVGLEEADSSIDDTESLDSNSSAKKASVSFFVLFCVFLFLSW